MEFILSQEDPFFAFYFILQEKQLLIKYAEYTCLILSAGLTAVRNHVLFILSGRDDSTRGNRNAAYLSPVIPRDYGIIVVMPGSHTTVPGSLGFQHILDHKRQKFTDIEFTQ
jgi:hypothetical protein